jgi:trans-2-enoyl-CoA reductase
LKTAATQTRCSAKFADIYKITKITDSDTTLEYDNINKDTKNVGKDEYMNGSYTNIVGDMSLPSNNVNGDQFSKEKKRQLRRKMRNVKKRPESYVVLGCI